MSTQTTTAESGIGQRTIESGRFVRATTERMNVQFAAPGIADVSHDGETYRVELESGACECRDYEFRGERLVCKHAIRACLAVLFDGEQRSTALVAEVARHAREHGCAHGVRGCAGPTAIGSRGYPCPDCVRAIDIEYRVEDRIEKHSEDVQLKRSILDETYNRWTQVERTNDAVKNCGLGPVRARGRVHARAQVFLALCLRVVVIITNDERGDNPGREILTA